MKNMNTLSIVALILIFLGGVGAILLSIGQSISSAGDKNDIINTTKNENASLKKELAEIRKERDALSHTLEQRDSNIQEQNKSIISLSEKLAEKSEYIQNYLTGGKSFPFLDIREFPRNINEPQKFLFQLENNFELPIYNIEGLVYDYEIVKQKSFYKERFPEPFIKLDDLKAARILDIRFDAVPANKYRTFEKEFTAKDGSYYIIIHARNQAVVEKIAVLKVGEGFTYGFQVLNLKGEILKQDIKKDLPSEIKAKVIQRLNSIPNNMKFNIDDK
jgi:hypothetical protein